MSLDNSVSPSSTGAATDTPPIAKRVPTERTHHGDTFVDQYEWLRDKQNPEVIAYLEAENAYTEARTAGQAPLRERIYDEIKARNKETDLTLPSRMGDWWYYHRQYEGKQHHVHCRCPISTDHRRDDLAAWAPPRLDADEPVAGEQVLLDSNELAEGHDYFALGAFSVSHDGTMLAYSYDTAGDERYELRFKNLTTGEVLPDVIPGVAPGATWSLDGEYVFYQTFDDAWRADKVWRHRLGTGRDADVLVFHETDERFSVGIGATRSERYLMIWLSSKITTEGWILESDNPTGEFRVLLPRREGVDYSAEHAVIGGVDKLLILHNDVVPGPDGTPVKAVNSVLAEAPIDDPAAMTILIDHDPQVRLEDIEAFDSYLVLSYRREALPRVAVWPLTETGYGERTELDFGLELFAAGVSANPEWDQPTLRIVVTSFITPYRVYDYVPATGELLLRKEQEVLGGYDPGEYEQHREWAQAVDGTRIPISVVRRKGIPAGPRPLLLYGYGSYEASIDPGFSLSRLSLLDRGMVFAVAHVRGGGELGRAWYDNGKTLTKKNTFTDFVACARHLVDTEVTEPDLMIADGGSAGGLLMGAVANLAPELFKGILTSVPFVDPLTSILDPSLPLTVTEWDEWGNPLEDPEVYAYMKSYSPYENVAAVDYPAILATTGLNDTRVYYVEPAKWIAALRLTGTGPTPPLLKVDMTSGHGGPSGRYEQWKEIAFEYAWVLDTVGLGDAPLLTTPAA
ncbi:S9 family peptidase [Nocardia stercoris]|uniref:S9 family peptidase n=1 Tax=Nocardia stercoris TaxID=2483361 RepID=A0A3M2L4Z7_9NOCA|nr:S9 family peptidase [Nocardia stercoris]RMI29598.1 S9 family peptidase [Nocardia stercoris]